MEIAPGLGLAITERTLTPQDLLNSEEVFISSTNRNLLGVGAIDTREFPGAPGQVTQALEKAFAAYVADYIARRTAHARP